MDNLFNLLYKREHLGTYSGIVYNTIYRYTLTLTNMYKFGNAIVYEC